MSGRFWVKATIADYEPLMQIPGLAPKERSETWGHE
jgi:hypothetical protein